MRVTLDDGCSTPVLSPGVLRLALDDGCCDEVDGSSVLAPPVEVGPQLSVRLRTRIGFDADGVAQFSWSVLPTSGTVLYETREEFDAMAGLTKIRGQAIVLYDGDERVTETASVVDERDGSLWRVLGVDQQPGRLALTIERIDSRDTLEPGS